MVTVIKLTVAERRRMPHDVATARECIWQAELTNETRALYSGYLNSGAFSTHPGIRLALDFTSRSEMAENTVPKRRGRRAECRLWQQFVGKPYSATVSAQGYRRGDRNTDCSNYKPQNQTRIIMGGWKYFISIGWCELVMLNPSPASRFNCVASKQHLQRILQYKIIPTKNLNFWPNFGSMLFQAVRPVWL